MEFPGRLICAGEPQDVYVLAIRDGLARRGYPCGATGAFDDLLDATIRRFQAQNVDLSGRPLQVDGKVGMNTWGALFGAVAMKPTSSPSAIDLQESSNTPTDFSR